MENAAAGRQPCEVKMELPTDVPMTWPMKSCEEEPEPMQGCRRNDAREKELWKER